MLFTDGVKANEFPVKNASGEVTGKGSASVAFASKPVANSLKDHLAVQVSTWQKLLWAAAVWYWFTDMEGAKRGDWEWVLSIIVRDVAITLYHGGLWDVLVYSPYSPFRKFLAPYKYNEKYPDASRFVHDLCWSLCSTVISSLFEAWTLYHWVQGSLGLPAGAHPRDSWWTNTTTILWLLSMPYWRLGHFFFLHRGMHKWFPGRKAATAGEWRCPDVGEFIYDFVHSLHHKAKNPTALSGISMHPVESSGYYTAMWVPLAVASVARAFPTVFPAALAASIHPIVWLYTKMGALLHAVLSCFVCVCC